MKPIILLLTGFILGIIVTLLVFINIFPSMMISTKESMYGFTETVDMIDSSSTANRWAVLKIIDLGRRMNNAGYEDAPRVKVIELCHAENTYNVLKNEDDMFISAIMPCRMAVQEKSNGKVFISRMNIDLMSRFFSPNVKKVMSGVALDDENILRDIVKSE
ncbi:MAG TPA: DUF302 domain-containing protein [Clostridiales bacterium]|nr:DUF302 domain-containing protein [Clostridiales bacterium]